jgi:hypothetical protein
LNSFAEKELVSAIMNAAIAKQKIESVLTDRFGTVFERQEKRPAEFLPTGVGEIDCRLQGFPRGAITEIHGSQSSGRTSILLATLAFATKQDETCALIDCSDTFDIESASKAEVNFDRLLWVRCSGNVETAFKSVDLLLHGGGFGLVALNLSEVPAKVVRRITSSWWFRFRRAIENTQTTMVIITSIASLRSCAAVVLELKTDGAIWPTTRELISDDSSKGLATQKEQTPRLSLVSAASLPSSYSLSLTHAHFIQKLQVRVNRERPIEWSDAARFYLRLH